jgi:hypothetical protein
MNTDDLKSLRRRVRKLEATAANTTKGRENEADIDLKQLIKNAVNEFNAVEILLLHLFDKRNNSAIICHWKERKHES